MGQAKFSYFDILKKRVLRHVKHFQNDFLIHDKDSLKDYQGEAIFAMRECGTAIMKLIQERNKDAEFDQNQILPWIFQENTEFYHLANGKARKVKKEEAKSLVIYHCLDRGLDYKLHA